MSDIDTTEAPPLPEWLARDPAIQPGTVRPRSLASPRMASHESFTEDSTQDGPTLPTMDRQRYTPPSQLQEHDAVMGQRITVIPDSDPNDWLLVAMGVSLSAMVIAGLIVLFGV